MRIQIVGQGRMGKALAAALRDSGAEVLPLAGRGANGLDGDGVAADVVLLAVPDDEISSAAALIVPGPTLGHLSGMTTLAALNPHDAFSLHTLLTITGAETSFRGAYAAVDGASDGAMAVAHAVAVMLGVSTFRVADDDRAAYHAAASIASNFLVVLEGFAESLAVTAGVPRNALMPLALASLQNWGSLGARAALTGPIARGDDGTVMKQRHAVADRVPQHLALFDACVEATRQLAAGSDGGRV